MENKSKTPNLQPLALKLIHSSQRLFDFDMTENTANYPKMQTEQISFFIEQSLDRRYVIQIMLDNNQVVQGTPRHKLSQNRILLNHSTNVQTIINLDQIQYIKKIA